MDIWNTLYQITERSAKGALASSSSTKAYSEEALRPKPLGPESTTPSTFVGPHGFRGPRK